MLIVIEGQSAVGKTTFVKVMPTEQVVGEEIIEMPPNLGQRAAHPYFIESNARRWNRLLQVEQHYGLAYADSDPLKLYYEWALVAIGELDQETFDLHWSAARAAMAARRYGFADHVIFLVASTETVRARKVADTTRRRGAFPLHIRLGKAMKAYYRSLERLRPGTVQWLDTEKDTSSQRATILNNLEAHAYERYDVAVLDQLHADLHSQLMDETQWELRKD